ncbi:MAG: phosphotransferase [Chloroflexi bacterium HGW-Chloroflexi-1]|nr:MAG: phosphotransferase [Chloroflexi bacterium HGW-Chloroflexi-1]
MVASCPGKRKNAGQRSWVSPTGNWKLEAGSWKLEAGSWIGDCGLFSRLRHPV